MKKILCLAALLLPVAVFGQTSVSVTGRAAVGGEYKIIKGLHVVAEEEIRVGDNFTSLGSMRTTLGVTWKPVSFIKLGAGYTLINPYKESAGYFNNPRHRLYGDVTASLSAGSFQFFLKERLQFTHRTGDFNVYQNTPNALALKSRIGVKYKASKVFQPSLSFELRTALNDPDGTISGTIQSTSGNKKSYYTYQHTGYTAMYINRYRVNLEASWKPSKRHTVNPYILADYCTDYEIDTNGEGTHIFPATTGYVYALRFTVGIGYTYNF